MFFVGIILATAMNMTTVRGEAVGPDGSLLIKGFPFEAGTRFYDSTNRSNPFFVVSSYGALAGNTIVSFLLVFGAVGNFYFFREIRKKLDPHASKSPKWKSSKSP